MIAYFLRWSFVVCIAWYPLVTLAVDDLGQMVDQLIEQKIPELFGLEKSLSHSSSQPIFRAVDQKAGDLIALASGLQATFITRQAANSTDMMVLWPNEAQPQYLITCVEEDHHMIALGKLNPSVQRIDLATGKVETLLRGMSHCDGIRQTPWRTILATEETEDGRAYEIFDPLSVTGEIVQSRSSGKITQKDGKTPSIHIAQRSNMPMIAWEGLEVLPSGVVVGGDELRPGTLSKDADGGALFKFVPEKLYKGTPIDRLDQSPLAQGTTYALQVWCYENGNFSNPQYGQGCEVGNASWVKVEAKTARLESAKKGATGFFRPEDLHLDPLYKGEGVRYCWTNTGNKKASHFAEVMCAHDQLPDGVNTQKATVIINRFIEGDPEFNSFDNLAFQKSTGNLYILEDTEFGDILACLPDGKDRNIKSDGCIRIASVKDPSAEFTGFIFSEDGLKAFVSIQHSKDDNMPLFDGFTTDDIIMITGWK